PRVAGQAPLHQHRPNTLLEELLADRGLGRCRLGAERTEQDEGDQERGAEDHEWTRRGSGRRVGRVSRRVPFRVPIPRHNGKRNVALESLSVQIYTSEVAFDGETHRGQGVRCHSFGWHAEGVRDPGAQAPPSLRWSPDLTRGGWAVSTGPESASENLLNPR